MSEFDSDPAVDSNFIVTGVYPVNQEHQISESVLQHAIDGFEGAATRFALDAIKDARVRQSYNSNIQRISEQVKKEVAARNCTVKEGAEFCNEMRNRIMAEHRQISSAQGRAFAEKKKPFGRTMDDLLDRYSKDKFNKSFSALTQREKDAIYYEIIESTGKNDVRVTTKVRKLRIMGKVGILITAAFATYEILRADDKVKEAAKQGMVIGGGALGGFFAGLGVSTVCGPGAPVCAIVVVLLGSVGGGLIGEAVSDTFDEELEEFSKWTHQ